MVKRIISSSQHSSHSQPTIRSSATEAEKVSKEVVSLEDKIQQLKSAEESIEVYEAHLRSLQEGDVRIDDAQYEVRKQSGNWRVYRNRLEVFKSKGKEDKHKRKCQEAIPSLKQDFGSVRPSQASIEASSALNLAIRDKEILIQEIESLKSQLKDPEGLKVIHEVEMQDKKRYLLLVNEQKQNHIDLEKARAKYEEAKRVVEKEAKKEDKLHEENKKTRFLPRPQKYTDWQESIKKLGEKRITLNAAEKLVDDLQNKIYKNSKDQLEASAPKKPHLIY